MATPPSDLIDVSPPDDLIDVAAPAAPAKPKVAPPKEETTGAYLKRRLLDPVARGYESFQQGMAAVPGELGKAFDSYGQSMKDPTGEKRRALSPPQGPGVPMVTLPSQEQMASVGRGALEVGKGALGVGVEAPLSMATGIGSSIAGGVAGAARTLPGLIPGVKETLSEAAQAGGQVVKDVQQAGTYQPRTTAGQAVMGAAAYPMEKAKEATGYVGETLGTVAGAPEAGRAIGEALPELIPAAKGARAMTKQLGMGRAALTQEQQAIADAQANKYRARPSEAAPGALNSFLESIAGEKNVTAKLTRANEETTQNLARQRLGLRPKDELTEDVFDRYRAQQERDYQTIKASQTTANPDRPFIDAITALDADTRKLQQVFNLPANAELAQLQNTLLNPRQSMTADSIINMSKKLRDEARLVLGNPAIAADAEVAALAKREAAKALEDLLDRNLSAAGQSDLVANFRRARENLAASHDIESATNLVTGVVDARVLGQLLKKGKPITAELLDIAEAQRAMPSVMKPSSALPPAKGLSATDIGVAGLLHKLAHGALVIPTFLARPVASAIVTSRPYQAMMAQPKGKGLAQFPMKDAAVGGSPGVQPPVPVEEPVQ